MTEDEAKTRWCPFTRVGGIPASAAAGISWNRWPGEDVDTDGPANCVGSACMAWRWSRDVEWQAKAEAEYRRSGRRIVPTDGYCGLASRPS